jgi:hypothetical protein
MIGYNRVSTPRDLAPSVLHQIALRERCDGFLTCGAHAYMLAARDFGICVADDGRLTFVRAHAAHVCMACQEWLLLAAAVPTHPMRANATGNCRDRALRGNRALNTDRAVR